MTAQGLKQITSIIAEEYGMEFTANRLAVWAEGLRDVTDEQGRTAVMRLVKTSPFPPRLAHIREAIFGTAQDQERALDEEAELALRHVEEYICDYRPNDWEWPVLHALVRSLGGIDSALAMMGNGDWERRRRDHKTLYKALRRRGVGMEEGAILIPQAVSEGFLGFGPEKYAERRLPIPIERHPFQPALPPALPSGVVPVLPA